MCNDVVCAFLVVGWCLCVPAFVLTLFVLSWLVADIADICSWLWTDVVYASWLCTDIIYAFMVVSWYHLCLSGRVLMSFVFSMLCTDLCASMLVFWRRFWFPARVLTSFQLSRLWTDVVCTSLVVCHLSVFACVLASRFLLLFIVAHLPTFFWCLGICFVTVAFSGKVHLELISWNSVCRGSYHWYSNRLSVHHLSFLHNFVSQSWFKRR